MWRPSTFLALQVQLVVLTSGFVTVSTTWSVSCFLLFFYTRGVPVRAPGNMESAPLLPPIAHSDTFGVENPAVSTQNEHF